MCGAVAGRFFGGLANRNSKLAGRAAAAPALVGSLRAADSLTRPASRLLSRRALGASVPPEDSRQVHGGGPAGGQGPIMAAQAEAGERLNCPCAPAPCAPLPRLADYPSRETRTRCALVPLRGVAFTGRDAWPAPLPADALVLISDFLRSRFPAAADAVDAEAVSLAPPSASQQVQDGGSVPLGRAHELPVPAWGRSARDGAAGIQFSIAARPPSGRQRAQGAGALRQSTCWDCVHPLCARRLGLLPMRRARMDLSTPASPACGGRETRAPVAACSCAFSMQRAAATARPPLAASGWSWPGPCPGRWAAELQRSARCLGFASSPPRHRPYASRRRALPTLLG